jgi:predicted nucleic acid-binding protein
VILVDSSVWIEHLRRSNEILTDLLDRQQVLMHPFVVGELALGHLRPRNMVLGVLQVLDQVIVARDDEVMRLIDEERLFAIGLG